MNQSLILSILLLLLSSSSPIHARNKSNPAKSPSPSLVATPAPGPSHSDCSTIIYDMMDCLSYITIGSNDTKPVKSCCVGIESVLEYNPQCICFGLASSSQMGFALNNTRALAMPKTCKLAIAPPHCDISLPGASAPGASTPSLSPVSPSAKTPMSSQSSAESPATSPTSTTVTAPSPSSSGTNNFSVPTLTLIAILISSIAYISALSS